MKGILKVETKNNSKDIEKIIDGRDDTCWFSHGEHEVVLELFLDGTAEMLRFEFQNGFHPSQLSLVSQDPSWTKEVLLDSNESEVAIPKGMSHLQVTFRKSHDPYGRICLYQLQAN